MHVCLFYLTTLHNSTGININHAVGQLVEISRFQKLVTSFPVAHSTPGFYFVIHFIARILNRRKKELN